MPPHASGPVVARLAGLRYVSDAAPGIRRLGSGRGFEYRRPRGGPVTDARTLARIQALAIPPAYRDVWICPDPRGHIQATGIDARGRKQYRYHADWASVRGEGKFDRIVAFGAALPRLRRRLRADLARPGHPPEKIVALVLAVLLHTTFRVGNEAYRRDNHSFGLCTLRERHLIFLPGGRARLCFPGKGGVRHEAVLDDPRLVALIRSCQQLPGQRLFRYRDDDGRIRAVDSDLVNARLKEAMGGDFTAKDIRTWVGTLEAFRLLAQTPLPADARRLARLEAGIVKAVAHQLGNTPAVCRQAYIDPVLFTAWRDGRLARAADGARGARQWEAATLLVLRAAHRARAGTAVA